MPARMLRYTAAAATLAGAGLLARSSGLAGWFLDGSSWVTRAHCGVWPAYLRWTYIGSNAAIAAAYFTIPACLVRYWGRRRHEPAPIGVLALFAAFITLCGLTHVCDVTVFWWAPYRLYTLVLAITGVVSVGTAALLPRAIRDELNLPSRKMLHDALDQAQAAQYRERVLLLEVERRNIDLHRRLDRLETMRASGLWERDSHEEIEAMRSALHLVDPSMGGTSR